MTFSERVRDLRRTRKFTQRELADRVGINFTYLSKIENDKLETTPFPGEDTIRKLAAALDADEDELLLLAGKVPDAIRRRVIERPDAFRAFAGLDDATLDRLLATVKGYQGIEGR